MIADLQLLDKLPSISERACGYWGLNWARLFVDTCTPCLCRLLNSRQEAFPVTPLEEARPAAFADPDPDRIATSGQFNRIRCPRLSLHAGAAPRRSFGRISVPPRLYQLAPPIMALAVDPVRLLIADDVGARQDDRGGDRPRERHALKHDAEDPAPLRVTVYAALATSH